MVEVPASVLAEQTADYLEQFRKQTGFDTAKLPKLAQTFINEIQNLTFRSQTYQAFRAASKGEVISFPRDGFNIVFDEISIIAQAALQGYYHDLSNLTSFRLIESASRAKIALVTLGMDEPASLITTYH